MAASSLVDYITEIADAIRTKLGTTDKIKFTEMASKILMLQPEMYWPEKHLLIQVEF